MGGEKALFDLPSPLLGAFTCANTIVGVAVITAERVTQKSAGRIAMTMTKTGVKAARPRTRALGMGMGYRRASGVESSVATTTTSNTRRTMAGNMGSGGFKDSTNESARIGHDSLADRLMVRLDPAVEAEALRQRGCVPMDFTGRPMKGFVFVHPEGCATGAQLRRWIDLALDFNSRATASKTPTRGIAQKGSVVNISDRKGR